MKYEAKFLEELDKRNLRTQYIKMILLSWDEKTVTKEIQGYITAGNLNINTSSALRRTINFSMLASEENSDLENIDNDISIAKKFQVYVGYKNPHIPGWEKYDNEDIIYFNCGMFVIATANASRSTSGWTINVTAEDKMCLLDGSAGGVLPASITFHERQIIEDNGDITTEYPTIFQIIYEAVNHWGGEPVENIIISDVPDTAKMLVKYHGESPVWFNDEYTSFTFIDPKDSKDYPNQYTNGDDIGYQETSFTYPGELILSPGDTVVSLLDKIKNVLGNYEYFYTVDGKFVFQQIKNYLNTGSPLNELDSSIYIKSYNNQKAEYSITDLDNTASINLSPNFNNLKNDFYVWGEKELASGIKIPIRYHLAIDTKPKINLAGKYMWAIKDKDEDGKEFIIRYEFTDSEEEPAAAGYKVDPVSIPCDEWREELYRRALVAQVSNSQSADYDEWQAEYKQLYNDTVKTNYYDSELLAEWRKLYDPGKSDWDTTNHWNPDVFNHPENLHFWIDFIDGSSEGIGKYRIKQIGRRTKVVNNTSLKTVYNKEVPDIVFIKGTDIDNGQIAHYNAIGQRYFILQPEYYDLFSISSTGASCFDTIREMMYQNLNYNTTITITCLPKYYMEPNTIIYVEDKKSNIKGNYQITQFSLPLAYNGTMNITATEVLTRV